MIALIAGVALAALVGVTLGALAGSMSRSKAIGIVVGFALAPTVAVVPVPSERSQVRTALDLWPWCRTHTSRPTVR